MDSQQGHHLGSCLQSHHIGLLELLTPRCLAAFSPALQKDTHPITGDPGTLRALGNHSQRLSSILRPQTVTAVSVFHHPQKDPLTQTKSFRTSMGPLLSMGEPHRPRERHFRIYYI